MPSRPNRSTFAFVQALSFVLLSVVTVTGCQVAYSTSGADRGSRSRLYSLPEQQVFSLVHEAITDALPQARIEQTTKPARAYPARGFQATILSDGAWESSFEVFPMRMRGDDAAGREVTGYYVRVLSHSRSVLAQPREARAIVEACSKRLEATGTGVWVSYARRAPYESRAVVRKENTARALRLERLAAGADGPAQGRADGEATSAIANGTPPASLDAEGARPLAPSPIVRRLPTKPVETMAVKSTGTRSVRDAVELAGVARSGRVGRARSPVPAEPGPGLRGSIARASMTTSVAAATAMSGRELPARRVADCFVVRRDGRLLTLSRAVAGAAVVWVRLADGKVIEAEVEKSNDEIGLALLHVDAKTPDFLPLATQPVPLEGTDVFAVATFGGRDSSTRGIRSTRVIAADLGTGRIEVAIEGRSVRPGAPLVNANGEVVAVFGAGGTDPPIAATVVSMADFFYRPLAIKLPDTSEGAKRLLERASCIVEAEREPAAISPGTRSVRPR